MFFLKEHLFADIFGRGVLSYQQRELATISVLATLPGLGAQLQFHIGAGIHVGLTAAQLRQVVDLLRDVIGESQADSAETMLTKVLQQ